MYVVLESKSFLMIIAHLEVYTDIGSVHKVTGFLVRKIITEPFCN